MESFIRSCVSRGCVSGWHDMKGCIQPVLQMPYTARDSQPRQSRPVDVVHPVTIESHALTGHRPPPLDPTTWRQSDVRVNVPR